LVFRFSQLPNIKVSPTSSVMQYKGKPMDVAQVAKDLGVDAVLSGRVLQLGDNLTISVELVDTRTKVSSGKSSTIAKWRPARYAT
jgi:TolB-like protein